MELKILSFSGKKFQFNGVSSITLMTKSGEITILENHTPLLTQIRPYTIHFLYKDDNNMEVRDQFFLGNGVLEVSHSKVKILSDVIIDVDNLPESNSEQAKEDAISLMQKYRNSKDRVDMEKFIEAEELLIKSISELKLSKV